MSFLEHTQIIISSLLLGNTREILLNINKGLDRIVSDGSQMKIDIREIRADVREMIARY